MQPYQPWASGPPLRPPPTVPDWGPPGPDEGRGRERGKRAVGLALYVIVMVIGLVLNALGTVLQIASSKTPHLAEQAFVAGAVPAFAMLVIYLPIPAILDRFDPEPWWCLAMAFFWGAIAATGVAGFVNSATLTFASHAFGKSTGFLITTCVSAPLVEEGMKGLAIFGCFYFLRREFDGVVDGIVYATFCALGFAAVENVQYYAEASMRGHDVFQQTFVLRGIIAPWGHPLYTSMTGIGFGVARETDRPAVRVLAPIVGLAAAMALHATWNYVPNLGPAVFVVSLLLWLAFVGIFFAMIVVLVARKGRTIRDYLKDEVVFGTLSADELRLVTSALGRVRTYFMPRGDLWRRFIKAAARLALSKWHTARAMRGKKRTYSIEFIGPMREELRRVRAEIHRR